jgi:transposase InsO family protein
MEVSESGYYRWLKYGLVDGIKNDEALVAIEMVHAKHKDNIHYGIPRMMTAIKRLGKKISKARVIRIMKEKGWGQPKPFKPKGVTVADKRAQKSENIIKQNFKAQKPDEKILTDVMEVPCINDEKIYLSAMFDCFNGEIIALKMADNMRAQLCVDTLKAAIKGRDVKGLIVHSDRGSQYTSKEYREALKKYGIVQSMSGTGRCYDNARMESFFATLRKEKLSEYKTEQMSAKQVRKIIFDFAMNYYNRIRIYTANPEGLSPVEYRESLKLKKVA